MKTHKKTNTLMNKKFYWFYQKELLWQLGILFLIVSIFGSFYFFSTETVPKRIFGIIALFSFTGFFPSLISFLLLRNFVHNNGDAYYSEFIIGYKLIPRLRSKLAKKENNNSKYSIAITIKELELMLENEEEGKLRKQKEIYELMLITANPENEAEIKKKIKTIELSLTKNDTERFKISEEISGLEEI